MRNYHGFLSLLLTASLFACGGGTSNTSEAVQQTVDSPQVDSPLQYSLHWKPNISDSWYYQLQGKLDTSVPVTVYDIDLFNTSQQTIDFLHTKKIAVVCYFSAGSAETWRSDYTKFSQSEMGYGLKNWPGERWVDTRSGNVRTIMRARLDQALAAGCDGVDPDNLDGYSNTTGFPLTANTQLDYNKFLANEAHARGLAISLKNDISQIPQLIQYFDFAINEQCFAFNECASYMPFIEQSKPVFNVEYNTTYVTNTGGSRDKLCNAAAAAKIYSVVMPSLLDGTFRYACR